jgi:MFS family permease
VTASGAYREILAIRDARRLIAASAASQLGDWLFNAALLGTVFAATGSARWVAAATICRLVPYVVLGPIGGLVADRYDRRTVLLAGDVSRCLLMVALAAVVETDGPVALILALTALASSAGTAERPAAMALLPRLVGEARLGPANALLHTVQDLGVVVGPAIGAVLLAVAPNSVAFLVNGLTFFVSAALISTLRRRVVPASAREGETARFHFLQGLSTARATPFVVPLLIVIAMAELTYGAQTVQLVVYAAHRLDLGAAGYGYLLTAGGVGGLLSAAVNPRLATSTRVSGIVVVSGALYCATQLAYAGVSELVLALAVTLIGGAGFVACEVVAETALARVAPAGSLGRLMGVVEAVAVGAMVAGALLAPVLLAWTSLRTSFLILGSTALLTTLACLAWLRGLDVLSRERAEALASRVAVVQRLPLVAGAPQLVIEQVAAASQVCPLPEGVDVVAQGAPAHAFYAVIDGGVLVHRDGTEVARLGPGDHFGERGLLDNAPRNATVTTFEPSTLLRLEGDALLDALQSVPDLRSALDRSNVPARASAPTPQTPLVDDPAWGKA